MKKVLTIIIAAIALSLSCSSEASAQKYTDIFQMIRGRVPGVTVGQAPAGQMPRITIRGIGTNSDETQPLFIVDGLVVENIATLDPDDVEEIDVIKDGSSSIYGMRGANGVIMITTKSAVLRAKAEAEARKAERKAKRSQQMFKSLKQTIAVDTVAHTLPVPPADPVTE